MRTVALALAIGVVACTPTKPAENPAPKSADSTKVADARLGGLSLPNADPYPSTYKPFPSRPTLIRNATIMTSAGPTIHNGSILLRNGKIVAVGTNIDAPSDAVVIDG